MTILVENYLALLNKDLRPAAHEWQGPNIPYGDDSNRPNLIRQCTMLENSKMKINCLRKLRDQAAMNPFYQHRIDRYIDEITDTYEPTEKPGTIPGNDFKTSGVGDDTKVEPVTESFSPRVLKALKWAKQEYKESMINTKKLRTKYLKKLKTATGKEKEGLLYRLKMMKDWPAKHKSKLKKDITRISGASY